MVCDVKDLKIYYEIHGEGTPVLMIHGWSPDHRLMKGCMEPVFQTVNSSWKRIYFDLPGMGKTTGAPWIKNSDQMLDIILDFVDAILPGQPFVVAGESYGGLLARGIINKRPETVNGLLLLCPVVENEVTQDNGGKFQVFEKDDIFLNGLSEDDRNYFKAEGINSIQNQRVWQRYTDEILPALRIADYSFLGNLSGRFSFNADALEKPFMKPTLMLAGRQDFIVGYRGLWQLIDRYPRASFVLLDKAGHNLQIEQDILFTETVKEWLHRVETEMV